MNNLKILRRPQVQAQTGLKVSAIYQLMQEGEFPKSIKLSRRAVGWLSHEIDEWIKLKIKNSGKQVKS